MLSENIQEELLNGSWNKQKYENKAITFRRALDGYSEKLGPPAMLNFISMNDVEALANTSWISEKRGVLYSKANLQMELIKDKAFLDWVKSYLLYRKACWMKHLSSNFF